MIKLRKILAIVLSLSMVLVFASCGGNGEEKTTEDGTGTSADTTKIPANFKIGIILLHDENSTYDKNFIDAAKAVQTKLGLTNDQVIFKVNVPEGNDCYETAAELVDLGCKIVFADSFGHESYMMQAAKEFPNVQFCHATGTNAKTANIPNYHNAFAHIYQGRFLAGVAAGMKLNQMIEDGKIKADEAKMGYIGAYPYAEVISGLTSFYLGAKYVCPSVTMGVKYTNSWFDIGKEKEAAQAFINEKCVLISQHADFEGAPKACEEAGVPNVAYNISTIGLGPNTALISSKIDWAPYFELIIKNVAKGESIPVDWCGGINEGSVVMTELNDKVAAPGTADKLAEVKSKLISGEVKVFDTASFKVDGKTITTFKADVIPDEAFTPDTEAIKDSYFSESEFRSAPYFYMQIDGITGAIPTN